MYGRRVGTQTYPRECHQVIHQFYQDNLVHKILQLIIHSQNSPGPIRTEIFKAAGLPQDKIDKYCDYFSSVLPLGRMGDPDDIADSILYLASDHAAFITGTNLISDGGSIAANAVNSKALKEFLLE